MANRTEAAERLREAAAHRADGVARQQDALIMPEGYALVSVEQLLDTPRRVRGVIDTKHPESFVAYVKRYGTEKTLVAAAYLGSDLVGNVRATLDYHAPGGAAQWGEHVATLSFVLSDRFRAWLGRNRRMSQQRDFMEFLEDNSGDIAYPDAAELMEAIRQFRVHGDVRFTQVQSLETGDVQFRFERTFRGQSETGVAAVPERLQLSLPVFRGCESIPVVARLRWNLDKEGQLTMGYSIAGLTDLIEREYEAQIDTLTGELGDYNILRAESASIPTPNALVAFAPSLTAGD